MTLNEKLKTLSKIELEKLVLNAAAKHKEFDIYLRLNYLDKAQTETELIENTKREIDMLMRKSYKGFSHQLQLANMLTACNKKVVAFSKVCKNKKAEADLLMLLLEIPFQYAPSGSLGTCFTAYDYKVANLVKKVITIVNTKLHPDYKIEYAEKINSYLTILHSCSSQNDFVYALPKSF